MTAIRQGVADGECWASGVHQNLKKMCETNEKVPTIVEPRKRRVSKIQCEELGLGNKMNDVVTIRTLIICMHVFCILLL